MAQGRAFVRFLRKFGPEVFHQGIVARCSWAKFSEPTSILWSVLFGSLEFPFLMHVWCFCFMFDWSGRIFLNLFWLRLMNMFEWFGSVFERICSFLRNDFGSSGIWANCLDDWLVFPRWCSQDCWDTWNFWCVAYKWPWCNENNFPRSFSDLSNLQEK